MLLKKILLVCFTCTSFADCASDFYKKLQDGTSVIPIDVKRKTDNENKYPLIISSNLLEIQNSITVFQRNNVLHNPVHQRRRMYWNKG